MYTSNTTSATEVILSKLRQQSYIFGNPSTIISDKGSAFTSMKLDEYCHKENIKQVAIATAILLHANGQVERLNSTVISVISKISKEWNKWFKHVSKVQQVIYSTY